jgi:hypothetical protein
VTATSASRTLLCKDALVLYRSRPARVTDGAVVIRPLPRLESRALVAECMLAAGEAAARFAGGKGRHGDYEQIW